MPNRIRSVPAVLCLAIVTYLALPGMAQSPPMDASQSISIPLLAPGKMSSSDAAVVAASQAGISRSAQIYGYVLDSSWTYRQIGCPFASKHLLLSYESTSPRGVASRFTAILRRGTEKEIAAGHTGVEIIPILHFGVVPFSPAEANPHTFDVFNQVVVPPVYPVPSALSPDNPLLLRSLCFTAMIGEPPSLLRAPSLDPATFRAPVPTVLFLENRVVRTRFSVRNSEATYRVWTLTFSSSGKLVAAEKYDHAIDANVPLLNAAATQSPNLETTPSTGSSSIAPNAPESASLPPQPMTPPPAAAASQPTTLEVSTAATAVAPTTPSPASTQPVATVPAPKSFAKAIPAQAVPEALPLPPRRVVNDLPLPPRRIIPDSAMSYPPQATTSH